MTMLERRADESPTHDRGAHVTSPRTGLVRRVAMRPRRTVVVAHRWLSLVLLAWLVVISITGAWLVERHAIESWLHGERYRSTAGDVGPQAAADSASAVRPGWVVENVVMPGNGRGVYQVAVAGQDEARRIVYVDPGTGAVNGSADPNEGLTWWLYRGHMHLWQDHGIAGVFHPDDGWCRRNDAGAEPGGVRGVVCDVIPDGDDMVAWFAVGWIVVLLTGFHLWYWPGVKRWANAFVIRRGRGRFSTHMSLHKTVGLVVWVPLVAIAFTGAAFAFPNLQRWYDNITPAGRNDTMWTPPETAVSVATGPSLDFDQALAALRRAFPDRRVDSIAPAGDDTALITAWMTRGFSPWSREGGAGNTFVGLDRTTGAVVYDGTPEEVDVFKQAWQDWSFPIHTGDFGGPVTRVIWVVVSLSPLALGFTGVVMQLTRRSKRRRRAVTTVVDVRDSVVTTSH
jgi:uncharacterized iron-regulated membrane protein